MSSTQDAPHAYRHGVCEVDPMPGGNHAPRSELELWSELRFYVRLRNGVDNVSAKDVSVPPNYDAATATKEVQMPDADMVFDDELVGLPKKIEVAYLSSIINATALHHQGREPESHAAANFVSTEMTIDGLLEPPGQKGQQTVRHETQHDPKN